jgi:hypothetical protein
MEDAGPGPHGDGGIVDCISVREISWQKKPSFLPNSRNFGGYNMSIELTKSFIGHARGHRAAGNYWDEVYV